MYQLTWSSMFDLQEPRSRMQSIHTSLRLQIPFTTSLPNRAIYWLLLRPLRQISDLPPRYWQSTSIVVGKSGHVFDGSLLFPGGHRCTVSIENGKQGGVSVQYLAIPSSNFRYPITCKGSFGATRSSLYAFWQSKCSTWSLSHHLRLWGILSDVSSMDI